MYGGSSDDYDLCPMGNLAAMGNLAEMAGGTGRRAPDGLELSIVLPCLNEAETVAVCVAKAVRLAAAPRVSPAK